MITKGEIRKIIKEMRKARKYYKDFNYERHIKELPEYDFYTTRDIMEILDQIPTLWKMEILGFEPKPQKKKEDVQKETEYSPFSCPEHPKFAGLRKCRTGCDHCNKIYSERKKN